VIPEAILAGSLDLTAVFLQDLPFPFDEPVMRRLFYHLRRQLAEVRTMTGLSLPQEEYDLRYNRARQVMKARGLEDDHELLTKETAELVEI
jgi:hypothetical protein